MKVWENSKFLWKHSPATRVSATHFSFSQTSLMLPYNSMETRKRFLFGILHYTCWTRLSVAVRENSERRPDSWERQKSNLYTRLTAFLNGMRLQGDNAWENSAKMNKIQDPHTESPRKKTLTNMRKILFCQWHKLLGKKFRVPQQESNLWPSAHRSDALPLSYRRLVGKKYTIISLHLPTSSVPWVSELRLTVACVR